MKMNSFAYGIAPAILFTGMALVSCQKNLDVKSAQSATSDDLQKVTRVATAESFMNVSDAGQFAFAINPQYASTDKALVGSCPPITTYSPSAEVYPHTVTVDWGTGCTTGSLTRSGKWITYVTGDMSQLGSSSETTYDNFYENGVKLEGQVRVAHNRETGFAYGVYRITFKNRKLTQTNGDYIIYGGYRRIVKRDNNPVYPGFPNGGFKVTGTVTGNEMKAGVPYQWVATIDVANPLIYNFCDFIVKGNTEVTFTNQSTWLVNYGTDARICDDQAELTVDGVTTTVTLPLEY